MGRITVALVALASGVGLLAQDPQPAAPQQPPTFRSGTNVVRVDVSVIERTGKPVTSLNADDFEVTEDGTVQPIVSFKLVKANGAPGDELSLPIRSPEHAAAEAARDDVRVFLIFWDEYHIHPFESTLRARESLMRFVRTAFGPTDLVAMMDPLLPTSAIRFTRDRHVLSEQVRKLIGRRGVYMPPRSVLEEAHLERPRDIARIRAEVTASALKAAAVHLGTLREGRKAIVLVSEGFFLPNTAQTTMRDIVEAANDSNTAIYTVDPRGLSGNASAILEGLAVDTGAERFHTNDLVGALRRVVTQASAFYLLGYTAPSQIMDGKFHRIRVKVKRPGIEVRARSGYWSPRWEDIERERVRTAAAILPPQIAEALAVLTPIKARRVADVWIGAAPGSDRQPSVTLAWAPRARTGEEPAVSITATVMLDERTVYEGTLTDATVSFPAPPGSLKIDLGLKNAKGELLDREIRRFTVPDYSGDGLAIGTPVLLLARTPAELRVITQGGGLPHAGREFVKSDRLIVRFPVKGSATSLSARLLNGRGADLTTLPVRRVDPSGGEIDFPLSSIARGDYLIMMEASGASERAEVFMALRVVR
jgi:VWFA-related protein